MRALLGAAADLCRVVVLKLRTGFSSPVYYPHKGLRRDYLLKIGEDMGSLPPAYFGVAPVYKGTSLKRNRLPLRPYRRDMPRPLCWS